MSIWGGRTRCSRTRLTQTVPHDTSLSLSSPSPTSGWRSTIRSQVYPSTSRRNFFTVPPKSYRCDAGRNPIFLAGTLAASAAAALAILVCSEIHTVTYSDANDDVGVAQGTSGSAFQEALRRGNVVAPDWTDYGVYRVDVASLDANNPNEDCSSYYASSFSPTTRLSFFGVYDGHNGGSTARKLAEDLPEVVCLHLADLYSSKHASDAVGDNPGEGPDPKPTWEAVHAAIREAFLELDDAIVNEAAKRALELSDVDYRTLNAGRELPPAGSLSADEDTSTNAAAAATTRSQKMRMLAPSYAGACALLGIYDSSQRALHVALTGDLRAVLGRRRRRLAPEEAETTTTKEGSSYVYEVHPLSRDQNASNPSEAARLTALHPNEPDLLKNGRVLGWGPARAFGDGIMKWSLGVRERLCEGCLGDRPNKETYRTPPYFTAEPVVTTFGEGADGAGAGAGVRRGDFVVLASDGLWDVLTNEEVVGLVGMWVERWGRRERVKIGEEEVEVMLPRKVYPRTTIGDGLRMPAPAASEIQIPGKQDHILPTDLPVIYPTTYVDKTLFYKYWRTQKKFVLGPEDESNVAKHLIKNAVGGADRDLGEALYSMEGSRRRRFRDDITIQVVFFE